MDRVTLELLDRPVVKRVDKALCGGVGVVVADRDCGWSQGRLDRGIVTRGRGPGQKFGHCCTKGQNKDDDEGDEEEDAPHATPQFAVCGAVHCRVGVVFGDVVDAVARRALPKLVEQGDEVVRPVFDLFFHGFEMPHREDGIVVGGDGGGGGRGGGGGLFHGEFTIQPPWKISASNVFFPRWFVFFRFFNFDNVVNV